MSIGLEIPARPKTSRRISESQTLALARTYDSVSSPVWIEDLGGVCIYQNSSAEAGDWPSDSPMACFEVLDHQDRVVARLGTIQH